MAVTALVRLLAPGTPGVGRRLRAVPRMIRATLRREYDGAARLAVMALSVLYLVSPLDFLADAVFMIVGVLGDAALVVWLAGALMDETERFLAWERRHRAATGPARRGVVGAPH